MGYAFINFTHPAYILDFYYEYKDFVWSEYKSKKICDVTYARIQGKEDLKAHFSNTKVIKQSNKKLKPHILET